MDFGDAAASDRTPWVFAFVLGLAFLLMLCRSARSSSPLTAIVLNLLSVGAAYGVLVLRLPARLGRALLGFHGDRLDRPWMPLFLFVMLFGLSMDYHVFVAQPDPRGATTRGLTTPTRRSRDGIARTAGVITSAALVMVAVFAIFATLSHGSTSSSSASAWRSRSCSTPRSSARCCCPPSMALLGERNWYLPRFLAWIPGGAREPDALRHQGVRDTPSVGSTA